MYQSARPRGKIGDQGFTLLEVMVAIIVLTVGLMSAALLMANIYKSSERSRYIALATQLASEELEDLSRWPTNKNSGYIDPHIAVPSGSNTCGITAETCVGTIAWNSGAPVLLAPINITSGGNTASVSYYDSVCLNTNSSGSGSLGQMTETYQMPCTGAPAGTGNYVTVAYSPSGQVPAITCNATTPTGMTFLRQWVIEQDQPVTGVRRITVMVTLMDLTIQPPVQFQMSMVRP
jgi:prepilin-type N-terminal cleavage/methylation domain-containing protein